MRRFLVPVLAAALLSTACFGSFRATQAIWKFNNEVGSNKWVDEIVFLALVIVPVYEIAAVADALLFNTIEFWTGNNPIASAATTDADGTRLAMERGDDGSLVLRHGDAAVRIVHDEAGLQAFDAAGEVIATAHRVDGALVIVDRTGVRTVGPEALARVAAGGPAAARALALADGAVCLAR